MENFAHEGLVIEAALAVDKPDALRLTWRGTSRPREPSKTLTPYLISAVSCAVEKKVSLEMRFESLEFFNSATVMAIIKCSHVARAKGVPMRIVYAPDVEWQKLSFAPMKIFETGDGLFEIVPVGPGAFTPVVGQA